MCSRPTTTVLRLIWPPVTSQLLMPAVLSCYRRFMPLLGCMHRMCHDNVNPIAVSFHAFCKALNGALRHMRRIGMNLDGDSYMGSQGHQVLVPLNRVEAS